MFSALAAVTERIGFIATASTTYEDPYLLARKFASLDHISSGRAGWNIVTTGSPHAAGNFGLEAHPDHSLRYERANEFVIYSCDSTLSNWTKLCLRQADVVLLVGQVEGSHDAGPLAEGWRYQRDEPAYVVRQNATELRSNLAAAKRYRDM